MVCQNSIKAGWKPNNHIAQGNALGIECIYWVVRPGLGFAACQSKKGNSLIIRLLPLQGVGLVWRIFTQGAALGYVLLPLRGVLFASFDTPPPLQTDCFAIQSIILT